MGLKHPSIYSIRVLGSQYFLLHTQCESLLSTHFIPFSKLKDHSRLFFFHVNELQLTFGHCGQCVFSCVYFEQTYPIMIALRVWKSCHFSLQWVQWLTRLVLSLSIKCRLSTGTNSRCGSKVLAFLSKVGVGVQLLLHLRRWDVHHLTKVHQSANIFKHF